MSEKDEEEEGGSTRGRPNAYWAAVRESGADTFGGSFRATPPAPRHGEPPPPAIGSQELCWCGEPSGHDWPGKASGRKHPRKEAGVVAAVEEGKIDRSLLRRYQDEIAEVMVMAIEQYGCRFKVNKNTIVIWPPSNGRPHTFGTSSTAGPDVKKARSWLARYVIGFDNEDYSPTNPLAKNAGPLIEDALKRVDRQVRKEEVEEADITALAEALNGPEHEVPQPVEKPVEDESEEVSHWKPFVSKPSSRGGGRVWEGYETNGEGQARCTQQNLAGDGPCGWTGVTTAVPGHERMVHKKEQTRAEIWSNPEVQNRKADHAKYNNLHAKVTEALDLLADLVDYRPETQALEEQVERQAKVIKDLRHEVARLSEQCQDAEQMKAERDDALARLTLIRESLNL